MEKKNGLSLVTPPPSTSLTEVPKSIPCPLSVEKLLVNSGCETKSNFHSAAESCTADKKATPKIDIAQKILRGLRTVLLINRFVLHRNSNSSETLNTPTPEIKIKPTLQ